MTLPPAAEPLPGANAFEGRTFLSAIADSLQGVRPGFGDGAASILLMRRAGLRNQLNWVLPILAVFLGAVLVIWPEAAMEPDSAFGLPLIRILTLDFLFFVLGGVSGWNMIRTWRDNPNQVEELSLTPLPPVIVAASFFSGPLAVWMMVLGVFHLVELVLPISPVRTYLFMIDNSEASAYSANASLLVGMVAHVGSTLALAWVHFESVRLAHWLFAEHAVPRIKLAQAAGINAIVVFVVVGFLLSLGSFLTGILAIILALFAEGWSSGGRSEFSALAYPYLWEMAAIPALLIAAWFKRLMCRFYERTFVRNWLLYQWSGAGESQQPKRYPPHLKRIVPFWETYYGMLEEQNAGVPPHRQRQTERYHQFLERLRQGRPLHDHPEFQNLRQPDPGFSPPPIEYSNSDSPSRWPNQRNAP